MCLLVCFQPLNGLTEGGQSLHRRSEVIVGGVQGSCAGLRVIPWHTLAA